MLGWAGRGCGEEEGALVSVEAAGCRGGLRRLVAREQARSEGAGRHRRGDILCVILCAQLEKAGAPWLVVVGIGQLCGVELSEYSDVMNLSTCHHSN